MKKIILFLFTITFNFSVLAQNDLNDVKNKTEYNSISEALKNPTNVKKLDLNNQKINFAKIDWYLFQNLEYLSLKNDNLKEIP